MARAVSGAPAGPATSGPSCDACVFVAPTGARREAAFHVRCSRRRARDERRCALNLADAYPRTAATRDRCRARPCTRIRPRLKRRAGGTDRAPCHLGPRRAGQGRSARGASASGAPGTLRARPVRICRRYVTSEFAPYVALARSALQPAQAWPTGAAAIGVRRTDESNSHGGAGLDPSSLATVAPMTCRSPLGVDAPWDDAILTIPRLRKFSSLYIHSRARYRLVICTSAYLCGVSSPRRRGQYDITSRALCVVSAAEAYATPPRNRFRASFGAFR